jgi:ribose 1,5-bisphosphate isomerase
MRAMVSAAQDSKAKDAKALLSELSRAADALEASRPTEPMMRNSLNEALRYFFAKLLKNKKTTVSELKAAVVAEGLDFEKEFSQSQESIAELGAKEIPKGATVLTHCHSSTVTAILKKAHKMGKGISAICCETRPLYQGRITAKELSSAGIPTTLIVDSASRTFMRDADLVLVGADAITSSGELVNKIGTSMVAFLAYEEEIKFYSAAELYKFDPLTLWGKVEPIEERNPAEIANPKDFPRVKIRNPAFDLTPAKHITAYITEHGVVAPGSLFALATRHFDLRSPMLKK